MHHHVGPFLLLSENDVELKGNYKWIQLVVDPNGKVLQVLEASDEESFKEDRWNIRCNISPDSCELLSLSIFDPAAGDKGTYYRLVIDPSSNAPYRFPRRKMINPETNTPVFSDITPGQILDIRQIDGQIVRNWSPIPKRAAKPPIVFSDHPILPEENITPAIQAFKNRQEAKASEEKAESKETYEARMQIPWESWRAQTLHETAFSKITLPENYPLTNKEIKSKIQQNIEGEWEIVRNTANTPIEYAAALFRVITGNEDSYKHWLENNHGDLLSKSYYFRWFLSEQSINDWTNLTQDISHTPKIAEVYDFAIRAFCQELISLYEHEFPTILVEEQKSTDELTIYPGLSEDQNRRLVYLHQQWFPNVPVPIVSHAPQSAQVLVGQIKGNQAPLSDDLKGEELNIVQELWHWLNHVLPQVQVQTSIETDEQLDDTQLREYAQRANTLRQWQLFWPLMKERLHALELGPYQAATLLEQQIQVVNGMLEGNYPGFEKVVLQLTAIFGSEEGMTFRKCLFLISELFQKFVGVWKFFALLYLIPEDSRIQAASEITAEECTPDNLHLLHRTLNNHDLVFLLAHVQLLNESVVPRVQDIIINNPAALFDIQDVSFLFYLSFSPEQLNEGSVLTQTSARARHLIDFFSHLRFGKLVSSIIPTREFLDEHILHYMDEKQRLYFCQIPAVRESLVRFEEWAWMTPIINAIQDNASAAVLSEDTWLAIATLENLLRIQMAFSSQELQNIMRCDAVKKYIVQTVLLPILSTPQIFLSVMQDKWDQEQCTWARQNQTFLFQLLIDQKIEELRGSKKNEEECFLDFKNLYPNRIYNFLTSAEMKNFLPAIVLEMPEILDTILLYLQPGTLRQAFLNTPWMLEPVTHYLKQTTTEETTHLGKILFELNEYDQIKYFLERPAIQQILPTVLNNTVHLNHVLCNLNARERTHGNWQSSEIISGFLSAGAVQARLQSLIHNMDDLFEILQNLSENGKMNVLLSPIILGILPTIVKTPQDLWAILNHFTLGSQCIALFSKIQMWQSAAQVLGNNTREERQEEEKQEHDHADSLTHFGQLLTYICQGDNEFYQLPPTTIIFENLRLSGIPSVIASNLHNQWDLQRFLASINHLPHPAIGWILWEIWSSMRPLRGEWWLSLVQTKDVFWHVAECLNAFLITTPSNLLHSEQDNRKPLLTYLGEVLPQVSSGFTSKDRSQLLSYLPVLDAIAELSTQHLKNFLQIPEIIKNITYDVRNQLANRRQGDRQALLTVYDPLVFKCFLQNVRDAKDDYQYNLIEPEGFIASIGNFFVHNTRDHVNGFPRYAQALEGLLTSTTPKTLDEIRETLSDVAQNASIRKNSFFTYLMKAMINSQFYLHLPRNNNNASMYFKSNTLESLEERERFRQWIIEQCASPAHQSSLVRQS